MQIPLLLLAFLSLAPVFSLKNPLNSESSWLLASLNAPRPAVPGSARSYEASNYLYELSEASHHYHNSTAWISVILAATGLILAYLIYYLFNGRGQHYSPNYKIKGKVWKLSNRNWYLDLIYYNTFVALIQKCMKLANWLDTRVIDPLINAMGVFYVIFSHITAWFDRTFVDGFVNTGVWLAGRTGQLSRSLQGSQVQSYILLMLLGVMAFLLWMIL